MSNMWWNFKQMQESALGSVFIFQKRAIGLDNYKSKESLSRVVVQRSLNKCIIMQQTKVKLTLRSWKRFLINMGWT